MCLCEPIVWLYYYVFSVGFIAFDAINVLWLVTSSWVQSIALNYHNLNQNTYFQPKKKAEGEEEEEEAKKTPQDISVKNAALTMWVLIQLNQ